VEARVPDRRTAPFAPSRTLLAGLVLALAVAATFSGTLSTGFVWDDRDLVVDNPDTHDLGSLGRVMLSPDLTPPYYRPLPRVLLVLEYAVFGATPAAFHLVSVLAHLAAAWLLFLWARRLFGADVPAVLAALLWALHPVGAEAVGFVAVRTAPLAALFVLATLLAVQRAADRPGASRAWFSGLLFLAALGCKEQAVMALPLAALQLRALRGTREPGASPLVARLVLLVGALIVYLVARVAALGGLLGEVPRVVGRAEAMGPLDMLLATGRYVTLFVWPSGLTVTHDLSVPPPALLLAGFVGVVGLSAWGWRRRTPAAVLGAAWFWLMLLPTLQVIALPSALFAERHAYLLYPGLVLMVVDLGLAAWQAHPSRGLALALVAASLAACGGLAARTVLRRRDWHDNRTLFESALAVRPSALAHLNLGNLELAEGHREAAAGHWRAAVELDPTDADALNQLGVLAAQDQRLVEARKLFSQALAAHPQHPVARQNLERLLRLLPGGR